MYKKEEENVGTKKTVDFLHLPSPMRYLAKLSLPPFRATLSLLINGFFLPPEQTEDLSLVFRHLLPARVVVECLKLFL